MAGSTSVEIIKSGADSTLVVQLSRFHVLCTFPEDLIPPRVKEEIRSTRGVRSLAGPVAWVDTLDSAFRVREVVESAGGKAKIYEAVVSGGEYRFECQRCGKCCSEAYILLLPREVVAISEYLGVSPGLFIDEFCEIASPHGGLSTVKLKTHGDGSCIFFEDHECRIQPVKPGECRIYPIIPHEGVIWWVHCPGSGMGRRYGFYEIRRLAGERYREVSNYSAAYGRLLSEGRDEGSILDILFKKIEKT
ncbi:hypothetical protein FHEFKHOI_00286 [Candidatus Methanoperedenaceae archaeon GB50]|nr:hypothetical protein FHEFKHOI_00286 [Candidatus Methanoperedenaceae archaeon GB50]CAD7773813.1 MAG: hypothetical protein KBONHNOK_00657 [Candidatus Methanoperedenaceae archaeon GB50]